MRMLCNAHSADVGSVRVKMAMRIRNAHSADVGPVRVEMVMRIARMSIG